MKHLFKFESFDDIFGRIGECREVNVQEFIKFNETNKTLTIDSKDLEKFKPLRLKSNVNVGEVYSNIHLSLSQSAGIRKFVDEWWSLSVDIWLVSEQRHVIRFFICDGIYSMLDLIQRVDRGEFFE